MPQTAGLAGAVALVPCLVMAAVASLREGLKIREYTLDSKCRMELVRRSILRKLSARLREERAAAARSHRVSSPHGTRADDR